MFQKGDKIDYMFYSNLEIVGEDCLNYILKDNSNNITKVYKALIDKHAKLIRKE